MATYDEAHHIVSLTDEEARSGVTGHNVRYVLAFGMGGVIAAFAAIALYYGFDDLQAWIAGATQESPFHVLHALAAFAILVLFASLVIGVVLGLWNAVAGPSADESQTLMRLRVAVQLAVICVIMVMLAHLAT
jgi:uncharacterized BrkB/YihY/UPF0761 family membrane protein